MAFRGLEGWNSQLRSLGQGSEGGRRQRDEHAVLEAKEKRVREEAFDFPHTRWQPLRWCAHPRELTHPTHSCFPAPWAIRPGGLCSPPWAVFLTRPHSTSPTLPIPHPFTSHRQLLPSPEKRMIPHSPSPLSLFLSAEQGSPPLVPFSRPSHMHHLDSQYRHLPENILVTLHSGHPAFNQLPSPSWVNSWETSTGLPLLETVSYLPPS